MTTTIERPTRLKAPPPNAAPGAAAPPSTPQAQANTAPAAPAAQAKESSTPVVTSPPVADNNVDPKVYPPRIAASIAEIIRTIGSIGKHGRNTEQNYNFRKWDHVLEAVSPLLADQGLLIMPSEIGRKLMENESVLAIQYEFIITNEFTDVWPERPKWTAMARIRYPDGYIDDKAASKCHTQAEKEFLIHLFKIRVGAGIVPDGDNNVRGEPIEHDEAAQEPRQALKAPNPNEAPKPVEPHTISVDGKKFEEWADQFAHLIESATTREELNRWIELNERSLEVLEGGAPSVHSQLGETVDAKRSKLPKSENAGVASRGTGAPAPGSSPPPPEQTTSGADLLPKAALLKSVAALKTYDECLPWTEKNAASLQALKERPRREVVKFFNEKAAELKKAAEQN